jgi:hypothetical protein
MSPNTSKNWIGLWSPFWATYKVLVSPEAYPKATGNQQA